MILGVARLSVREGQAVAFEAAFAQAQRIIAASPGYIDHRLERCIERADQYLSLVDWRTLEDHEVGFRGSAPDQEWKRLLHHFDDPFPTVLHFETVVSPVA